MLNMYNWASNLISMVQMRAGWHKGNLKSLILRESGVKRIIFSKLFFSFLASLIALPVKLFKGGMFSRRYNEENL